MSALTTHKKVMATADQCVVLSGVVGLKTSLASHSKFLTACLQGIEDVEGFIEYCRENKEGISYATKTERLDTLTTRFKKIEFERRNAKDLETLRFFSERLAKKVASVRTTLEDLFVKFEAGRVEFVSWDMFRDQQTKEQYFTPKEKQTLRALGDMKKIIELSKTNKLQETIANYAHKKFMEKLNPVALEGRVSALLGGVK